MSSKWSIPALMAARFVPGYDTDAQAFITAAGITNISQQMAISQLVLDLKAASLWNSAWALWPIVGGDATKHSYNLYNPSTFQLTYSGTITHDANGMQGDGLTGYANTGLVVNSSFLTTSNGSFGVYVNTNTAPVGLPYDMGSGNDAGVTFPFAVISRYTSDIAYAAYGNGTYGCNTASSDSRGFWITNCPALNSVELRKNGPVIASASEGVNLTPNAMLICAFNGGGTPMFFSSKRFAGAFVMPKQDNTSAAALYNAFQTFNTSLGRQV